MKGWIAISLTLLFISFSLKDLVIYVSFKINQQQIEKEWCINKNEPLVMCAGSCYLVTQLTKEAEKQNSHFYNIAKSAEIFYLLDAFEMTILQPRLPDEVKHNFYSPIYLTHPYRNGVFRPPISLV